MPTKDRITELSLADLEELTGVTYKTLRKRLQGIDPIRQDGRSFFYEPRPALEAIYMSGQGALEREKTRLASEQADTQALKNAELRREQVKVADSEATQVALASAIAARMQQVPAAIAEECAATSSPSEAHALIARAIRDGLTELADAEIVEYEPDPDPDSEGDE